MKHFIIILINAFNILSAQELINYKKIDGKIYYFDNEPLQNVDIKTFRELKNPTSFKYYSVAGIDKNAIYLYNRRINFTNAHKIREIAAFNHGDCLYIFEYNNKIYKLEDGPEIKGLNIPSKLNVKKLKPYKPEDFTLYPVYFSDGKNIYYFDIRKYNFIPLKGLNPKKFKAFDLNHKGEYYWGTDGKIVYFQNFQVKDADPKTFECLGGGYCKDKNKVYFVLWNRIEIIKEADPLTFELVRGREIDAVDKNYRYYNGKIVGKR
ncbi:MAG: DKNYY domain-containing protein [Brevinematia bacterium]